MKLSTQIEAVLFHKNEPVEISWLSQVLGESEELILAEVENLYKELSTRGLVLIQVGQSLALGTNPESSELIERITKAEIDKELSKAALETLAVVAYKGPLTRGQIDYIRGVNSQYTVRHLHSRGLIERLPESKDVRGVLYRVSIDLLKHLGLTKVEDLPGYSETKARLTAIESNLVDEESSV